MTPSQPSPEHKIPDPWLEKRSFLGGGGRQKNAARAKQKRSAGLLISLCDLCLTARIIWKRPAYSCCLSPKRVLHLTA